MNFYKIIVVLALFSLLGVHPQRINAEPQAILSPKEYIKLYATNYKTSEETLLAVARCESNFEPKAIGDHGLAKGIFQYHKNTFEVFSSLLGEKLEYTSYKDQAKLTAYVFAKHPELRKHWSCYRKIKTT